MGARERGKLWSFLRKINNMLAIMNSILFNVLMSTETLKILVNAAGGQSGLARMITEKLPHMKVRQSHVWHWCTSTGRVPPGDYIPVLEAIAKDLGLTITGRDIRPEIYPAPSRKMKVTK